MSLIKWDPFRELEEVSSRLNRFFASPNLGRSENGQDTMMAFDWSPRVDVAETAEEFIVKAELPDVKKEDVKVSVDGGVLQLKGERKHEKEEKDKKYHRIERSYGSFMRTFVLPENVDANKIRAEFKDGMLSVRLAKTERHTPKAIDVKIG